MKTSPKSNFPINVQPKIYEVDPSVASYYANIFCVTLNREVPLIFVPNFSEARRPFDSRRLPSDLDNNISGAQEARLATALFSRFVVTPDSRRAGHIEQLVDKGYDDDPTAFFFVTPEEYNAFAAELNDLAEWLDDRDPGMRYENLLGYQVIEFIGRVFVESTYLSPYERQLLGRSSKFGSIEESGER